MLQRQRLARPEVVAEAVGPRLEHGERLDVGLLLGGVGAPGRERDGHVVARVLRRLLDRGASAQHDHVGQRDLLAADCEPLKSCWTLSRVCERLGQLGRLVDRPVLLRREADARTVGPAALVGAAERGRRRPGGGDQPRRSTAPRRGSSPSAPRRRPRRPARGRPRGPGPATAAARGPTGRGSARPGPCRGAAACTRPSRRRRRARRGSRRSAWRSARRPGPPSAPGRW